MVYNNRVVEPKKQGFFTENANNYGFGNRYSEIIRCPFPKP